MHLILAVVVAHDAGSCDVRVVGEPGVRTVGYSEPFRPRATSLSPGCLVAVDTAADPAVVVWRWFPARVLAVEAELVRLEEQFHGDVEAPVPSPAPRRGDFVYVGNGLTDGWRIDADAEHPERAAAALPEIERLYSSRATPGP